MAERYRAFVIPAGVREQLRNLVHVSFDRMMAEAKPELKALIAQRQGIEAEQDRLLDAYRKQALGEDAHTRKQREQTELQHSEPRQNAPNPAEPPHKGFLDPPETRRHRTPVFAQATSLQGEKKAAKAVQGTQV